MSSNAYTQRSLDVGGITADALSIYFQRFGLLPGREFDVGEVEPYNELMLLQHGEESIPVGMAAAHKLWVRVIERPLTLTA